MQLQFRSFRQAECYYKICKRLLKRSKHGPENTPFGRDQIRNAIYRSFGYNHFPDFQRNFTRDERIQVWFHSEEQLKNTFTQAITDAVEFARGRGFQFDLAIEQLVAVAVSEALAANDRALQTLISHRATC